jgi:pSer/pThr/pTyr-binding forkhead associated (FHA) protein
VPPLVLNVLKFLLLALLYLFIARALRIIWLDLAGPRARPAAPPRAAAAPTPRRRRGQPRTLVVVEPEAPARTYPISQEPVTIGRSDACRIVLRDTYVSQVHARVFPRDGQWFVEDLGSTNGTYLNRVKVTGPAPIAVGDEIRVGKTTVEVGR